MCSPKKSGTYKLEFKSGKQYIGKGGTARMKQSIRRIEKPGDKLKMKKFRPASTDKEAFIREAKWMDDAGWKGKGTPGFYNKINSPGHKFLKK